MSFEEKIMSKNKYPNVVSKSSGGSCVYYPSNIFRKTHRFENGGIFGHVTRLGLIIFDTRKNIQLLSAETTTQIYRYNSVMPGFL